MTYSYGASTNVGNVVDVLGQNWGYDYGNSAMKLTCVRQVNSATCQVANVYDLGGRPREVARQTTPDGAVWNYYYQPADPDDPQLPGRAAADQRRRLIGPEGIADRRRRSAPGCSIIIPRTAGTTYLQWDGLQLKRLHHPEGNNVSYTWYAGEKVAEIWKPSRARASRRSAASWGFPTASRAECLARPSPQALQQADLAPGL